MVENLTEAGADVVIAQKGIDDMAQHYLAQEGILAVRRAKKSDIKALSRSTGARVVSNIDDVTEDDLGFAGSVAQKDVGGDERIFVEDVEDAKAVTLILRGGTEHVVDEIERAIDDSLGVVAATLEDGKVLPGGGAPRPNWPSACATTPTPSAAASSWPSRRSPTPSTSSRERSPRTPGSIPSTRWSTCARSTTAATGAPASTPTPARSST